MEELQEADILWPDSPPSQQTEEHYIYDRWSNESVLSNSSSDASPLGRLDGFLSGPSTAPSPDTAEEFREADVLWPDTVGEREDGGFRWLSCDLRAAVRHVKHGGCEGRRPLSSPIDIPGKVIARRRSAVPVSCRRWHRVAA